MLAYSAKHELVNLRITISMKKTTIFQFITKQIKFLLSKVLNIQSEIVEISHFVKEISFMLNKNYTAIYSRTLISLEKDFILEYEKTKKFHYAQVKKLMKALDTESANTVTAIMKRMDKILALGDLNAKHTLDFYSEKEKVQLKKLTEKNKVHGKIQISPNVFMYEGKFLPVQGFAACTSDYKNGLPELSQKIQNSIKGKNILDVGAFICDSALVFQEWKPNKIYSFEANPENAKLCKKTLRLNDLENVEIVEYALGDEVGEVYIANESSPGTTIKQEASENTVKVSITTLDTYINENNIQDIALIKVDIEGFEQPFLRGAVNTIKEQKPLMLLSIYHSWADFVEIKPLIESWNLGYTFKIYKPTDGAIFLETLLICIPSHLKD